MIPRLTASISHAINVARSQNFEVFKKRLPCSHGQHSDVWVRFLGLLGSTYSRLLRPLQEKGVTEKIRFEAQVGGVQGMTEHFHRCLLDVFPC